MYQMKNEILYRRLNLLSISFLAFFLTQVLHEFIHLAVAQLMGFEILGFHLFAVKSTMVGVADGIWRVIMVEASASVVNMLMCLVAIVLFYRLKDAYMKLAAMLTAGFQGMMGFGYLLFDGLFYTPGALGDWKAVLDVVQGALSLRISIIVIGALGFMALFFWLGKAPLVFLSVLQRENSNERAKLGLAVLVMPYVLSVLLNVPLAFWHPIGFPQGFFVIFFQYIFGYSGFVTGFFMLWTWLAPKPFLTSTEVVLVGGKKVILWCVAVFAVIVQLILVFGLYIF